MARFLAGEGSRAQPSPAGRGGPARPGPAPHAAARSRGSLRGWHRGRGGGGSAPLPAAALKGAERRRAWVGCDLRSQVSAVGVAPTAAAVFPASLPLQPGAPRAVLSRSAAPCGARRLSFPVAARPFVPRATGRAVTRPAGHGAPLRSRRGATPGAAALWESPEWPRSCPRVCPRSGAVPVVRCCLG